MANLLSLLTGVWNASVDVAVKVVSLAGEFLKAG